MTRNASTRILVIEDESDIRDLLLLHLGREGYVTEEAPDGNTGFLAIESGEFDLYVIDWMLPQMSGIELIRRLRQERRSTAPVLMVTARIEPADIVAGLEAGADDYVTKPFELPVLLARVRALLRRARSALEPTGSALATGAIRIDLASHEVYCAGERVDLTPSEFKLMVALARNQGRVLTRQKLIDLVQGEGVTVVDRAIDTHVFGLRKKLGECGEVIETVRGVGYRVRTG
jgi:two-component system phosphate regulon response regulator PhoB